MKILLLVDRQTDNFANEPKNRLPRLNLTKVVAVTAAGAAAVPVSADIRFTVPVTE
jgi:hypothetical protein